MMGHDVTPVSVMLLNARRITARTAVPRRADRPVCGTRTAGAGLGHPARPSVAFGTKGTDRTSGTDGTGGTGGVNRGGRVGGYRFNAARICR